MIYMVVTNACKLLFTTVGTPSRVKYTVNSWPLIAFDLISLKQILNPHKDL